MNYQDHGIDIPYGSSGEIRTLCPECSPSRKKSKEKCLAVNLDKETWFCHHCGHTGGLNSKQYSKPEYKPVSQLPQNVVEWFKKRGIPEQVLIDNQIGYGPSFGKKAGIQFPYFKRGKVVNIKHRSTDKCFRQEKGAEKCLYRFDEIAKGKGGTLIITEGEIDSLSFCATGFNFVASIPDGAPSADSKNFQSKFDFLKSVEKILEGYDKVILATDTDEPGIRARDELARRIGTFKCYTVAYPEGCKDANDVLVNHGKIRLRDIIRKATPYPIEGIVLPKDLKSTTLQLYEQGTARGLSTGFGTLNDFYTVKPCEMTIVTGIPGSGKSNFLDALMINMAKTHGWKFGLFSPENWPPERHVKSLLEKYTEKPFSTNGYHQTRMSEKEVKAGIKHLNKYFSFIMPKEEMLTVDTILEKAKQAIFRYGINGLVIDPWNEVEHNFGHLREDQYISKKLTQIRQFARRNRIHIWVVAHPRNLTKDDKGFYKPPTMYEISGGAHWRNKADNGLCIHRADLKTDQTEVIVQKIRFKEVGRTGGATLRYCRDTGNYTQ